MAKSFLNIPGYPIGLRNNNPGNLRPGDNWQGMIGTNGGFIQFQNIAYGLRALGIDLRTKINNGYNTIELLVFRYAPPGENDTLSYINSVSDDTGLSQNHLLTASADTLKRLIRAIANVELGRNYSALISDADILEGLGMMGGTFPVGEVGFGVSIGLFLFALYLVATMPRKTIIKPHPGY